MKSVFLRARRWWYLALFSTNVFSSRLYSIMSPLLRKNRVFRLYPNRLIYLFLAVFAFSSPFCYAKTAFSYSPDILSPCTPVLFMVKDVVKSVSEKMICGHCFEENKSRKKRKRSLAAHRCKCLDATSEIGSANASMDIIPQHIANVNWNHVVSFKKKQQLCGQAQSKLHGQTMWSEQRTTYHSFLRRCCIVTLVKGFVKAPRK